MKILVTNDDGINSLNLKILVNSLKKYASEILVVAPKVEMSATSHKLTLREGLEVVKCDDIIERVTSYYVSGTPADCVKVGLYLLNFKPDVVFSGINDGYNVGTDILYSGTVAAVMEASLCGYKGVAVSFKRHDIEAKAHLEEVLDYLFNSQIYKLANVINVNIPSNMKGIKITNQGVFPFDTKYIKNETDGLYYPDARCIGLEITNSLDSDVYNVYNNYVSITPLSTTRCDLKLFEKLDK